jgi:phosphocarrier protein
VGLHARPAALFVQAATAAAVPVRISKGEGKQVDARSILGVLALGAKNGDTVRLEADGDGADAVLDSLVALLEQDLDEPAPADA